MAGQIVCSSEENLPNGILPGDLMVNILLKLPVKSLLKFEAVSKPWRSTITSTHFVRMHFKRQATFADQLILSREEYHTGEPIYALLTHKENNKDPSDDDVLFSENPWSFPTKGDETIFILDSCNGLICLGDFRYGSFGSVILWNPATRKYSSLALPCPCFNNISLGYLEKTNEFKIVGLINIYSDDFTREVWIYSSRSNSWKKLDHDPNHLPMDYSQQTFLNGCMHFLTRDFGMIAAFDLADEVLNNFAVPDSHGTQNDIIRDIAIIRGCLSIIVCCVYNTLQGGTEIWVMEEYGAEGSWSKRFVIERSSLIIRPVGSWKDGELVIRCITEENTGEIMFYDPFAQRKKCYPEDDAFNLQAFNYVESLIDVEGIRK